MGTAAFREASLPSPRVAATIPLQRPLLQLLDDALISDAGLDHCSADVARAAGEPVKQMVSTDGNLDLECATPHGDVLPWSAREDLVKELRRYREPDAAAAMLGP